jgi:tetratricopeptide (TPR) repeat protein
VVRLVVAGVLAVCGSWANAGEPSPNSRFDEALARGQTDLAASHFAPAVQWLKQALSVRPAHADARYQLGLAYQGLGRLYDARRQFRLALSGRPGVRPWEGQCRLQIAECWEQAGEYRQALLEYRLALRAHPDLAAAQVGKRRMLARAHEKPDHRQGTATGNTNDSRGENRP